MIASVTPKVGIRYFGIGFTTVSRTASRLRMEMKENRAIKKTVQDIERELLSEE